MTNAPLTYADVAPLLGCKLRRVQTLVARGELPSFLLGRKRCFRREDVETFLAHRIQAEQAERVDPYLRLVEKAVAKGGRR